MFRKLKKKLQTCANSMMFSFVTAVGKAFTVLQVDSIKRKRVGDLTQSSPQSASAPSRCRYTSWTFRSSCTLFSKFGTYRATQSAGCGTAPLSRYTDTLQMETSITGDAEYRYGSYPQELPRYMDDVECHSTSISRQDHHEVFFFLHSFTCMNWYGSMVARGVQLSPSRRVVYTEGWPTASIINFSIIRDLFG